MGVAGAHFTVDDGSFLNHLKGNVGKEVVLLILNGETNQTRGTLFLLSLIFRSFCWSSCSLCGHVVWIESMVEGWETDDWICSFETRHPLISRISRISRETAGTLSVRSQWR